MLTDQQCVTVGTTLVTALLNPLSKELATLHCLSTPTMSSSALILCAKEAVLNFAKGLPGGVAEPSDFKDWGKKFVGRWVCSSILHSFQIR
jgi:hypothetical protein